MKRIIIFILSAIMIFSLVSCKNGKKPGPEEEKKSYVGSFRYNDGVTLVISGDKATFSKTETEEHNVHSLLGGKTAIVETSWSLTGIITNNYVGIYTITFNVEGAKRTARWKITGDNPEGYIMQEKQEWLFLDEVERSWLYDLLDGKTRVTEFGDSDWEKNGTSGVYEIYIDENAGTFTQRFN